MRIPAKNEYILLDVLLCCIAVVWYRFVAGSIRNFNPIRRLRCEKTCLTGPLEYKYGVIFVLVLSVICNLQSSVG